MPDSQETVARRLEALEAQTSSNKTDISRQADSLTHYGNVWMDVDRRVDALETERHVRQLAEARQEERDKSLYKELEVIKESIKLVSLEGKAGTKEIKDFGMKAFWIVAGAVILAFVAFMLSGRMVG